MKYTYVVTLKNRQAPYIDWTGMLLSFLSSLLFLFEMIKGEEVSLAYLLGTIFILGVLAWNVYQSRVHSKKVYYSRALLIAALVWMKMPYLQGLSIVFILLALMEYQAKYAIEVGFSESHILLNNFFKKKIPWSSLHQVVLKDGLLTIDFRSNKIWQKEVEEEDDFDADEDEFNEWCKQQVENSVPH
jgi:hypothetical protein